MVIRSRRLLARAVAIRAGGYYGYPRACTSAYRRAPASTPLCRTHHRELHRSGSEFRWWQATGIDPLKIARKLWKKTRLNGLAGHGSTAGPQCHRTGAADPARDIAI